MPYAPAKPCHIATCSGLQPCSLHPRIAPKYDSRHRRWADAVKARAPGGWCQAPRCIRQGNEADHITKVRERPDLQYSVSNGQWLCKSHHSTKTAGGR